LDLVGEGHGPEDAGDEGRRSTLERTRCGLASRAQESDFLVDDDLWESRVGGSPGELLELLVGGSSPGGDDDLWREDGGDEEQWKSSGEKSPVF
jgi:hypothetical protein